MIQAVIVHMIFAIVSARLFLDEILKKYVQLVSKTSNQIHCFS